MKKLTITCLSLTLLTSIDVGAMAKRRHLTKPDTKGSWKAEYWDKGCFSGKVLLRNLTGPVVVIFLEFV